MESKRTISVCFASMVAFILSASLLVTTNASSQTKASQEVTVAVSTDPDTPDLTAARRIHMSLEELEKRVQALEDVEEIKKLHQHYIDLMDHLRYEEVLDLFTEDATSEIRNFGVKKGRKEMAEIYLGMLAEKRGSKRFDSHMAIEPDIIVDGNTAKGTWLIYIFFSKPEIQWVQGKNECEYRKESGIWKISKLKFTRTLASDPSQYP